MSSWLSTVSVSGCPATAQSFVLSQAVPFATIVRLAEHDGELLHWFYDQGLEPGRELEVREAQPAAGQMTIRVDGDERAIGGIDFSSTLNCHVYTFGTFYCSIEALLWAYST